MPLTIAIPTINDTKFDFEKLYRIYQACMITNEDITFDFSNCHFFRQNATAFIIGLTFRIQLQRRKVSIFWGNCDGVVKSNLARNGFNRFFNLDYLPYGANTIETRWFSEANDEEEVASYLADNWLGRGWLNISPDLAGAIIGNVYELFANSFEHSKSIIGVLTSGQHYPNRHELVH